MVLTGFFSYGSFEKRPPFSPSRISFYFPMTHRLIFEMRVSVRIEMFVMFVTSISFRGTLESFWDLTEVRAQSWYKVRSYELVNPTFKISLLTGWFWKKSYLQKKHKKYLGTRKHVPLSLESTWHVPLSVCDHSQGFYFPPNHRRWSIVCRVLFQQTNKQKQNCPRSIAGVPFNSVGILRTTLLLRTSCVVA